MLVDELSTLADWIRNSSRTFIMTGAGVSAESGLSTFRGQNNSLWKQYDPHRLASREGFAEDPQLVWDWYQWRRQQIVQAQPNSAHTGIAWLQQRLPVFLVTQNVDGLHHKAGSELIYELHGNIMRNRCYDELCDYSEEVSDVTAGLSFCPQCHKHYLRPSVVWFGENLDTKVLSEVERISSSCELFLSVGTSSLVYPAAGFAHVAHSNGARLVEINIEATALSDEVDLLITSSAGEVFEQLEKLLSDL